MNARRFDRRQFILGGAAVLVLSACVQAEPLRPTPTAPSPPTAAARPKPLSSVSQLFARTPVAIAHRGSGDNWTEHSLAAYTRALAAGAAAIEVSVSATADGVLICHHDTNTLRLTGVDHEIASTNWAEIAGLRNDARAWLGPSAPTEPIARLDEVLDAFASDYVIFIEDKQGTNTLAILTLLDAYPDATDHIVWKQWAAADQHALAAERGYRCWGYFTEDLYERIGEFAGSFDYLGVPHTAPDSVVTAMVAAGKPVIAWEVHSRAMRDRLLGLGVTGLMCSNLPYVTSEEASARSDAFVTGLRAAGDLPWSTDLGWSAQPSFAAGAVRLEYPEVQSYLLGSLCPIAATSYTIAVQLRWPDALPGERQHAGVAFGQADDSAYRVGLPSAVGGYHAVIRANGALELFRREAGEPRGVLLGAVATPVPVAGEWISLFVDVTERRVKVSRDGDLSMSVAAADRTYRGGYFSLGKNYAEQVAVEFAGVEVE